jgi:hypothetical protein
MKRAFFGLAVFIVSVFLCFQDTYASRDLKPAATLELQKALVKALPVESHIARIAVLDLEGDDGTIRDALISAITENTNFKIIERKDLNKILDEQGLQLKDIIDEKTRIKPGRLKGVQALLIGKLVIMEEGFMSYRLKARLKLDDVEKGEILFSKEFDVKAVSPLRDWIIYGGIGILAILLAVVLAKIRRPLDIKERIKEDAKARGDVTARVDITKEIARASDNVSEAKSKLMDKGKTDEAVLLKEAEKDLLLLKEHVDNAARGSVDMRKSGEFKQVLNFDRQIINSFMNLTKSADNLYNKVSQGNLSDFEKEVEGFKRSIKNTIKEFSHRKF